MEFRSLGDINVQLDKAGRFCHHACPEEAKDRRVQLPGRPHRPGFGWCSAQIGCASILRPLCGPSIFQRWLLLQPQAQWGRRGCNFDYSSSGWPTLWRYAMLQWKECRTICCNSLCARSGSASNSSLPPAAPCDIAQDGWWIPFQKETAGTEGVVNKRGCRRNPAGNLWEAPW